MSHAHSWRQKFLQRRIVSAVRPKCINFDRIRQLIAHAPRVQVLGLKVVADGAGVVEGIRETNVDVAMLSRVQIERQANFGVSVFGAVDSVEDSAGDEHFAEL